MDKKNQSCDKPNGAELLNMNRMRHKYIQNQTGEGYASIGISDKTMVRRVKDGVLFTQEAATIVLTKEELVNEFKICLETGFIKKEDVWDSLPK